MKIVFISAFMLLGSNSFASNCTDIIYANEIGFGKDYDGNPLPESILECIESHEEGRAAFKVYCSANQKDISADYKEHLKYRNIALGFAKKSREATSQVEKSVAISRMLKAQGDLRVFGRQEVIAPAFMNLSRAHSDCREQ